MQAMTRDVIGQFVSPVRMHHHGPGESWRLDGRWSRLVPAMLSGEEPVLELRDPNSGQGGAPETKPRHQYRCLSVPLGQFVRRVLPPEMVGDRWLDDGIDEPWWEPWSCLPESGPLRAYWECCVPPSRRLAVAADMREVAARVVAYTPNAREVRRGDDNRLVVQPHNDNYLIHVPDLRTARIAYFRPAEFR